MNFPALTPSDLMDARLFATREDMLAHLGTPIGGMLAEVGVALGDFSEFMIRTLQPRRFIAIDTFDMHLQPEHWGRLSTELFEGKTHEEFYRARFNEEPRVDVRRGVSHTTLDRFPDHSFDLIYVDAAHDYDNVTADAMVAARKLKSSGVLVFNDYTLFDPFLNTPYGVVPAVNELIRRDQWQVMGFALQRHMFCDIALRRATAPIDAQRGSLARWDGQFQHFVLFLRLFLLSGRFFRHVRRLSLGPSGRFPS